MKKISIAILTLVTLSCSAADYKTDKSNPSSVRVTAVESTPEADNVNLIIVFPKEEQIVRNPVDLQLRVDGYPIGNTSDFDRRKKVYDDPKGQSVRVIIDEMPYFSIYKSFVDTLDDSSIYYKQTLNLTLPSLKSGMHVIRSFPVRSYGESLKDSGCFQASIFYIGSDDSSFKIDLQDPLLTYNEPQGTYSYSDTQPLLLDFYLTNARLSKDGYKVRLIIDKKTQRILTSWQPYYIYGLSKGSHTVKLELLDSKNKIVPGPFNSVEKKVVLQ
ncbi:MAG: hypothetical protein L0207_03580 [Chlamydiae bacterium]|nr:hypothetical protein [Chlamydiota bacterium]